MKTSQKGINLIKQSEGCELKQYYCSANKSTIGYGTTILPNGKEVPKDSICTMAEAEFFLKHDLEVFEIGVNKFVTVPINQNQFDALVCLTYNIGLGKKGGKGGLYNSSILRKININPNDESIKDSFLAYSKADGTRNGKDDDKDGLIDEKGELQTLIGLQNRRKKEADLYFS